MNTRGSSCEASSERQPPNHSQSRPVTEGRNRPTPAEFLPRVGALPRLNASDQDGPNTSFALTTWAAGGPASEIASALIASGAEGPPAVRATAVSAAVPLRAHAAAQRQNDRPPSRCISQTKRRGSPCP